MLTLRLNLQDILEIKRNILQKYGGTVNSAFDLFEIEQNNIISTNISRYMIKNTFN